MPAKTPRKSEHPILWIVAGPNGSGKSSLYDLTSLEGWGGSVWIITPDLLTATIREQERLPLREANLAAVQRVEAWLDTSVAAYQTIGVETVLSSDKYQRLVPEAQARGFEVRMIYVLLDSADLQLARIRRRVSDGGHDVPTDKVIDRRGRSFEQFAWFAPRVDRCFVFNNSSGDPELAAVCTGHGPLWQMGDLPEDFLRAMAGGDVDLRDQRARQG